MRMTAIVAFPWHCGRSWQHKTPWKAIRRFTPVLQWKQMTFPDCFTTVSEMWIWQTPANIEVFTLRRRKKGIPEQLQLPSVTMTLMMGLLRERMVRRSRHILWYSPVAPKKLRWFCKPETLPMAWLKTMIRFRIRMLQRETMILTIVLPLRMVWLLWRHMPQRAGKAWAISIGRRLGIGQGAKAI